MNHGERRLDRLRKAAVARLRSVSDSPGLDADLLLAHTLGRPRSFVHAFPEHEPDGRLVERFRSLIDERATGRPLAQITGKREFWSLTLMVSPSVLTPRPETEHLVERALDDLARGARVLDLGTGSGAIALALAHERPDCAVVATDIDPAALALAQRNAETLGLGRITFHQADWFDHPAIGVVDCVVANPPYIGAEEPEIRAGGLRFEPRPALVAADQGLAAIRRVIDGAREHLSPGGRLLLEHGWQQGAAVREQLSGAGFRAIRTHHDLAGLERVTEGARPAAPAAKEHRGSD